MLIKWRCTSSNFASREQRAMAIRAMRCKSGNRVLTKYIEVSCKVFSLFFSLKQNKVNRKNWGENNFEVSKKQKDVWDVFFKIKKKDDGDWN